MVASKSPITEAARSLATKVWTNSIAGGDTAARIKVDPVIVMELADFTGQKVYHKDLISFMAGPVDIRHPLLVSCAKLTMEKLEPKKEIEESYPSTMNIEDLAI